MLGGLNCGEHHYKKSCLACRRIREWYAAGEVPDTRPTLRNAERQAHAEVVLTILVGQPVTIGASWCASVLRERAGPWADYEGPQLTMTARFWELAQACGEETKAALRAGYVFVLPLADSIDE